MEAIAVENIDGSLSITPIIDGSKNYAALASCLGIASTYYIIDLEKIPSDRYFRNAWECHPENGTVVNMDKARDIHMNNIREARKPELEKLDIEAIKAFGRGDQEKAAAVEAQKQLLRDIPKNLDLSAASTPEELKAIWPEDLQRF